MAFYITEVPDGLAHALERQGREIEALWRAVKSLRREDNIIMSKMDDLEAAMAEDETGDGSLRAYVDLLAEQIKAAGVTDARIDAVITRAKANTAANYAKLVAHVPATPEQPPADPNAPPA